MMGVGIGLDLNSESLAGPLSRFRARHPYFQEIKTIVQRSSACCTADNVLTFMITASLLAAVLQRVQKHNNPFSVSTTPPLLSSNAEDLPGADAIQSYVEKHNILIES